MGYTYDDDEEENGLDTLSQNASDAYDTGKRLKDGYDKAREHFDKSKDEKGEAGTESNKPDKKDNKNKDKNSNNQQNRQSKPNGNDSVNTSGGLESSTQAGESGAAGVTETAGGGTAAGTGGSVAAASGSEAGGAAAAGGTVAAPIILIAIAIIAVILLIFFFYFLTEDGAIILMKEYAKNKAEGVVTWMEEKKNNFKDVIGLDGKWGLDVTEQIVVTEDMYDSENEVDLAYIEQYKTCKTLFNGAYVDAYNQIKKDCKTYGLDEEKTLEQLKAKYPNEADDVYKDANIGELITVLDFGFDSHFYTEADVNPNSDEALLYMRQKLMDSAFNKNEFYHYFYYITYSEPIEEDVYISVDEVLASAVVKPGAVTKTAKGTFDKRKAEKNSKESKKPGSIKVKTIKYSVPTIHIYCWSDIYDAMGIDPEAIAKDSKTAKYTDLQESGLAQVKANCMYQGQKRAIYSTLNLDGVTSWSKEYDGASLESILGESVYSGDMFDTSGWYTEIPVKYMNIGNVVGTCGGVNLYDGPTCQGSPYSYYVNTELALSDIYNDIGQNVDVWRSSGWCGREFGSISSMQSAMGKTMIHGLQAEVTQTGIGVKNGRYAIACAPGIVHKNYWNETGGVGSNAAWYEYGDKKMDLVVEDKNTGSVYYIPVTTMDAKGHAFPYGIVQTGIAFPNSLTAPLYGATFKTGYDIKSRDYYYSNLGTANNYMQAIVNYDADMRSEGYSICQWMSHGVVEWFIITGTQAGSLNNQFNLKGIIVY